MKKKTAVIASSVAAIALCSSIVAGSTFALFTSESQVNIAVTSATVDLSATIGTVHTSGLNGVAMVEANVVGNNVELNNIAPGDEVTFTVKAENTSTISTLYRTKIEVEETELASALVVTIADVEYEGLLKYTGTWTELAAQVSPADLQVKVAFPNSEEDQNNLQGKNTTITVTVEGVQANAGYKVGGTPKVVVVEKADVSMYNVEETDDGCVIKGFAADADPTELYIPSKVDGKPVTIAANAFKYGMGTPAINSNIEKVTVNCETVPSGAFSGCVNLTEVVIGDNVKEIGANAFAQNEFYYGSEYVLLQNKLEKIHIPANVTTIGAGAFAGCPELTEITFDEDCQITEISASAFKGTAIEELTIPSSVTTLGAQSFMDCRNLQEITIPSSVETIGKETFRHCPALQTINYGGTKADWEAATGVTENALYGIMGEDLGYIRHNVVVLFNDGTGVVLGKNGYYELINVCDIDKTVTENTGWISAYNTFDDNFTFAFGIDVKGLKDGEWVKFTVGDKNNNVEFALQWKGNNVYLCECQEGEESHNFVKLSYSNWNDGKFMVECNVVKDGDAWNLSFAFGKNNTELKETYTSTKIVELTGVTVTDIGCMVSEVSGEVEIINAVVFAK